jgi:hypothetical protein
MVYHRGKKELFKNSQPILCHVKPLGVGFTVTRCALSSPPAYPMKPTPISFTLHKIFHLEQ